MKRRLLYCTIKSKFDLDGRDDSLGLARLNTDKSTPSTLNETVAVATVVAVVPLTVVLTMTVVTLYW